MTAHHAPGAAPVGRLADLPPLEQRIVIYTRLWTEGRLGQAEVWRDLIERHGPASARLAAQNLEVLLHQTLTHARRPLRRHAASCPCAGGDECVFARFVALAAEGAREDAILMAALIVRADISLGLTRVAEEFGLTLMRGMPGIPGLPPLRH